MLGFIVFHLINFHFVDKTNTSIFEIVSKSFENSGYVAFYVAAMIVVALHVSHGLWSAFQTIGANHPKYMPIIQVAGIAFSIIVAIGFGFIPIYISILA